MLPLDNTINHLTGQPNEFHIYCTTTNFTYDTDDFNRRNYVFQLKDTVFN